MIPRKLFSDKSKHAIHLLLLYQGRRVWFLSTGKKPKLGCWHLLSRSVSQDFAGGKALRLPNNLRDLTGEIPAYILSFAKA